MAVVVVHHLHKQIGPVDPFDLISGPRADMGCYSIVSSARASIAGAISRPSVLAVFILMTNLNFRSSPHSLIGRDEWHAEAKRFAVLRLMTKFESMRASGCRHWY